MRNWLLAFLFAGAVHGLAASDWHTFTDVRGRKTEARILKVGSDHVLVELKASGRQLPIDFDQLSDRDVTFLRSYEEPASTGGKAGSAETPSTDEPGDGAMAGDPEVSRLYPKTKEDIRRTIREIENRPRPDDISKAVHEATQKLNVYRYLCNIPYEVESHAGYSKNAENAALACQKHGGLSHKIGSSTDRCNLSTINNLVASVSNYIEDSGAKNRLARGHRAWCLNPPMGQVGFGAGDGKYSAMWCMDQSGDSVRGSWSYPGMGLFPVEYMHGNAWSLYGAGQPNSPDQVKVEIHRLFKRPDKPFSATAEIPGHPVKVLHVSTAMNGINFEPEEPAKRGIYWISVRGGGVRESYLVELY